MVTHLPLVPKAQSRMWSMAALAAEAAEAAEAAKTVEAERLAAEAAEAEKLAAEAAEAFPRQALHAATLGFAHPVSGEMLRFEAPLPADMVALLAQLRGETAS